MSPSDWPPPASAPTIRADDPGYVLMSDLGSQTLLLAALDAGNVDVSERTGRGRHPACMQRRVASDDLPQYDEQRLMDEAGADAALVPRRARLVSRRAATVETSSAPTAH